MVRDQKNFFIFALPPSVNCIEIILGIPGTGLENKISETLLYVPKMRGDTAILAMIIKEKTGHLPVLKNDGSPCTPREEDDQC